MVVESTYKSWTKGTVSEAGTPRYSANWVTARRAWFKTFSDRVECGDWVIPASSVQDAILFETKQWFIPVFVLAVTTSEHTWQFGFNPWSRVASHLPFSFRRERVRLQYSLFSIIIRGILLAYLIQWLWGKFNA